jgi:PE family/PPE-SVP subfamily C-terminal region
MSFVTTQPESLVAAASALEHLGTALAAEDAAAAPATSGVIPAAADEVSALQAAQFSAYGTWYQQVSAQAKAVHQQLVTTLGSNAGAYGDTEAANQVAAASTSSSGALSGATTAQSGDLGSSFATFGTPFNWFQNTGAAASDFIALGQGQFLPGAVSWDPHGPGAELAPFMPTAPAATSAATAAAGSPVLAGVGQASSLGRLSVPPGWAAAASAADSAPATLAGAGWTSPAPHPAPVTAMPAGLPPVASAGRAGHAFGAPRYGVKPTVMPNPTVV